MIRKNNYRQALLYGVLCTMFWIIVDFGTAGGFRLEYFQKFGPTLLLFYIGYPVVFTFLIFGLHLREKWLLLSTLVGIFIVEVVCTGNPLVMNYPACLAGIPLAIAVYAPLTFFPLWIVTGKVRRHLPLMVFLSLIELSVICLTTFGSGK